MAKKNITRNRVRSYPYPDNLYMMILNSEVNKCIKRSMIKSIYECIDYDDYFKFALSHIDISESERDLVYNYFTTDKSMQSLIIECYGKRITNYTQLLRRLLSKLRVFYIDGYHIYGYKVFKHMVIEFTQKYGFNGEDDKRPFYLTTTYGNKSFIKERLNASDIKELNLPIKVENILKSNNINTLYELMHYLPEDLLIINGICEKHLMILQGKLHDKFGISFNRTKTRPYKDRWVYTGLFLYFTPYNKDATQLLRYDEHDWYCLSYYLSHKLPWPLNLYAQLFGLRYFNNHSIPSDAEETVNEVIQSLPSNRRLALTMYYKEGMSTTQIAKMSEFNLSTTRVTNLIRGAISKLRRSNNSIRLICGIEGYKIHLEREMKKKLNSPTIEPRLLDAMNGGNIPLNQLSLSEYEMIETRVMGLKKRTFNCLWRPYPEHISTLDGILKSKPSSFAQRRDFGVTSFKDLVLCLATKYQVFIDYEEDKWVFDPSRNPDDEPSDLFVKKIFGHL